MVVSRLRTYIGYKDETLKRWYFHFDTSKVPIYPISTPWIPLRSSSTPTSSRPTHSSPSKFRYYVFLIFIIFFDLILIFNNRLTFTLISATLQIFELLPFADPSYPLNSPNTKFNRSNCRCMVCNTNGMLSISPLGDESP